MKKITALSALSAAAMAIPAQAEVAPTDKIFSYRYTSYQESDAPRERTFTPELGRYQIEVQQFGYQTPLDESWYLASELQFETMSGASPTQTYKDANGKSALTMSGASIEEQRIDIKVAPKKYFAHGTAGGLVALSKENDYESIALGLDGTLEIFDKHTTLIGSLSVSNDKLSPTDARISASRTEADGRKKRSFSVYEGINQIIDKYSSFQAGISYTQLTGYLSDPYKFEDRRPGSRDQVTFSVQHKQFSNVLDGAALHSSYRYYYDDWGIESHTLDVKWAQSFNLGKTRLIATPLVRYYTQTKANFYSLEQNPTDDLLNSSDYRLSSYGAITIGLNSELKFKQWALHLDWQQYTSREIMALFGRDSDETPALVNFSTFTAGIDYKF
ncbi:conserved hypothetical protein [Oleispira antarctica RB-8]|uniref:DUF3570 domain-containing protein n=1 Tax=Oleispira antarctica RB-8 TaxID=698738 RepID=R4YPI5_OLEAN|nr:conserved hypothetical protein [Oleispira antarctica RB-8]